jgi:hypothetical protein
MDKESALCLFARKNVFVVYGSENSIYYENLFFILLFQAIIELNKVMGGVQGEY